MFTGTKLKNTNPTAALPSIPQSHDFSLLHKMLLDSTRGGVVLSISGRVLAGCPMTRTLGKMGTGRTLVVKPETDTHGEL
jgi:hypothetical protein